MKSVLIATGPGFQDEEVIYPWYRFKEDFKVDVVTSNNEISYGKYGTKIRPTLHQDDLLNEHFDCIFVRNSGLFNIHAPRCVIGSGAATSFFFFFALFLDLLFLFVFVSSTSFFLVSAAILATLFDRLTMLGNFF